MRKSRALTLRSFLLPVVLIVLAVVVILAAPTVITMVTDRLTQSPASMELTATVESRMVRVVGTTDLPDGALVDYSIWRADQPVGDGGTATVHAGRVEFAADLSDEPVGELSAYVEFGVGPDWDQPAGVAARYGPEGERLAGPQVYDDATGNGKLLVAQTTFTLGP